MSIEGLLNTGPISPFLGENRTAPQSRLPLNVSPDAEGIDYRDGTIKKRKGYARLHQNRILGGGIFIENSNSVAAKNMSIVIPRDTSYHTAEFQFELTVEIKAMADATPDLELATCHDGTNGWQLKVRLSGGSWLFDFVSELTGPVTKTVSVTLAASPIDSTFQIWFGRDATNMYIRTIDSAGAILSAVTAHSGATLLPPISAYFIGGAQGLNPTAQNLTMIVDEFVVWKKGAATTFTPDRFYRGLTVAEQADVDLLGYWRFNDVAFDNAIATDSEGTNDGFFYGSGGSREMEQFVSMVTGAPGADGSMLFNGNDQCIFSLHSKNFDNFTDGTRGDDWTVEFWFSPQGSMTDQSVILLIGDDTKPLFRLDRDGPGGANKFQVFWFTADSGLEKAASFTVLSLQSRHIRVTMEAGVEVKIYINNVLTSTTAVVGLKNPGYAAVDGAHPGLYIGAEFDESLAVFQKFAPCQIDEVRVWAVNTSKVSKGDIWDQELEITDPDLLAYYKLNQTLWRNDEVKALSGVGSDLQSRADAVAAGDRPRWSEGLVEDLTPLSRIYGLGPFENPDINNELLAITAGDYWRMKNGVVSRLQTQLQPNNKPWSTAQYRSAAILCNEHEGVWKYDGQRVAQITPDAPDSSGVVVALTAGDITGVVTYKLVFKNGGDGSQSVPSAVVAPTPPQGPQSQQVDFTSLPVSDEPQVSLLEIYRTQIDATDDRYFFLVELLNGTTTYTDNDDTLALAGLPLTDTLGQPPLARFVAIHQERIFVAEGSQLFYSEVTSTDNPAGWTQFDSRNVIDIERKDGHSISGMASTKTGMVVTKSNNGIYQVLGAGTYAVERFSNSEGFVSHNSIAVSAGYVYGVRRRDIARIPLPLGQFGRTALQDVESISDTNRSVFEGLAEADWQNAQGVFDLARGEYRLSITTNSEHIEMVYDEDKGTWSKRALPIDGYTNMALTTTAVRTLAAIGGYLCEIERNDNDGGEVDGTVFTLTGTATGGTVDKLTDTGLDDYFASRFSGLKLTVEDTGDAAKTLQERIIYSDAQDDIFVSVAFARAPVNGDRYWIAPIDSQWNSPAYSFPREGSDFIGDNKVQRLRLQNIDVSGNDVELTHAMDGATAQELTATLDSRTKDYAIKQRGEEFIFGFRNRFPDEPFDIEVLSLRYTEGKRR